MFNIGVRQGQGFPHLDFTKVFQQRAADREALNARSNAEQLQSQLDRLEAICMALWSLVREKTNLTDEGLAKRMQEIDLANGVQDGKITHGASICPQCNRPLSLKHHRCLYCGYTPPTGDFAAETSSLPLLRLHPAGQRPGRLRTTGAGKWQVKEQNTVSHHGGSRQSPAAWANLHSPTGLAISGEWRFAKAAEDCRLPCNPYR